MPPQSHSPWSIWWVAFPATDHDDQKSTCLGTRMNQKPRILEQAPHMWLLLSQSSYSNLNVCSAVYFLPLVEKKNWSKSWAKEQRRRISWKKTCKQQMIIQIPRGGYVDTNKYVWISIMKGSQVTNHHEVFIDLHYQ